MDHVACICTFPHLDRRSIVKLKFSHYTLLSTIADSLFITYFYNCEKIAKGLRKYSEKCMVQFKIITAPLSAKASMHENLQS